MLRCGTCESHSTSFKTCAYSTTYTQMSSCSARMTHRACLIDSICKCRRGKRGRITRRIPIKWTYLQAAIIIRCTWFRKTTSIVRQRTWTWTQKYSNQTQRLNTTTCKMWRASRILSRSRQQSYFRAMRIVLTTSQIKSSTLTKRCYTLNIIHLMKIRSSGATSWVYISSVRASSKMKILIFRWKYQIFDFLFV